ncbi:MAG: peptide chain release factor N(5)-glutamine methyltransferase [Muribaculaceae bacterium]|nr:peptide chain release factor N(5)-glutamine methyltransferase [Muribaculaceae bacterium]
MTTIRASYSAMEQRLTAILRAGEGRAAARIIFEDVAGYSPKFIFVNGDREMDDYMQTKVDAVAAKIEAGEPVQYAVGKALFMGDMFTVTPAVLIPRPETAGLVDLITDRWADKRDLRVLDLGTGSGCIAIELAKALPFSEVKAVDISKDALDVAAQNAKCLHASVTFENGDILALTPPKQAMYDIIVSNPPYICTREEADMDKRVKDYEPSTALFVPDDDPMKFYRPIGKYAYAALRDGGQLFLEINSLYADLTADTMRKAGFDKVETMRDFKGNYRFVVCTRSSKDA